MIKPVTCGKCDKIMTLLQIRVLLLPKALFSTLYCVKGGITPAESVTEACNRVMF